MELKCSPFAKNIYSRIKDAGKDTFNPAFCKIRGVENAMKELKPYIAELSAEAVITLELFSELSAQILVGKKEGSTLSLTASLAVRLARIPSAMESRLSVDLFTAVPQFCPLFLGLPSVYLQPPVPRR